MKSLLPVCLLLFPFFLGAQSIDVGKKSFTTWLNQSAQKVYKYRGYQLEENPDAVAENVGQFVKTHYDQLADSRNDLDLETVKTTPLGYHVTFQQTHLQVPIYGTQIKVNVTPDFKILSVFAKLVHTHEWENLEVKDSDKAESESTIIFNGVYPQMGTLSDRFDPESNTYLEELIGERGFYHSRDLGRYLTHAHDLPDSLVHVYVYYPDPITSEQTIYGGGYKNIGGRDTLPLNQARKLKTTLVKYLADSFWAENKYVEIIDPKVQNFAPAYSRVDTFDFDRSQPEFDQINALFHITNYHDHLAAIGFDSLANYKIQVNTRGLFSDQSRFNRRTNSGGEGTLEYGYGDDKGNKHVDDAEDADVVIHEFGHALSYNANENKLSSFERRSLDEGICDYLACSYSRDISAYAWEDLFNWDGHNVFWDGRSCTTERTYDDYSDDNSIYENGEILAGTLMTLWEKLGRDTTDALMIGTLYMLADNSSFPQTARLLLDTDSLLNKGRNSDVICKVFTDQKFFSESDCVAGIGTPGTDNVQVDFLRFLHEQELQVIWPENQPADIKLYDMGGKLLVDRTAMSGIFSENVAHLGAGVYLLEARVEGRIFRQRLVKP